MILHQTFDKIFNKLLKLIILNWCKRNSITRNVVRIGCQTYEGRIMHGTRWRKAKMLYACAWHKLVNNNTMRSVNICCLMTNFVRFWRFFYNISGVMVYFSLRASAADFFALANRSWRDCFALARSSWNFGVDLETGALFSSNLLQFAFTIIQMPINKWMTDCHKIATETITDYSCNVWCVVWNACAFEHTRARQMKTELNHQWKCEIRSDGASQGRRNAIFIRRCKKVQSTTFV